jgi:actin-related protein 6
VFVWQIDTVGRRLVLSDPLFTPDEIRRTMCEVVFEEYEFGSLYTAPPALFAATARRVRGLNNNSVVGGAVVDPFATQNCGIVVDVGYSATHVVPIFDGRVLNYAVRRVDVGGKAMTNYMKELLSFRHFDVMEETHLVNEITEQVCFVARDFEAEMRAAAAARDGGALRCRYLLPNYADRLTGRLLGSDEAPPTTTTTNTASATAAKAASSAAAADDDAPRTTTTTTTTTAKRPRDEDVDQVLVLTNERIVVPELLMRPSDIGMRQGGVGDAILEAVRAVPSELAPALLAAIELVGGAAQYRNLRERIAMQVRAASDDAQAVDVALAPRPAIAAWLGAALVARQPYVERLTVARRVYDEQGVYYVLQRLQS